MEQSILERILQESLFYFFLIVVIVITRKIVAKIIDTYFARVYKTAKSKGRSINKKRFDTLAGAFKSIVGVSIWVIAVFVVLGHYNVNTAALITGAGAVGIFFSIAGKDIIMDIYVGMMALLEDQYRVGDEIEVNKEHAGTVEEITLRVVKLRADDGSVHIVPHSLARSIINKTYDYATAIVEMRIPYSAHSDEIKTIVNEVGAELGKDDTWGKVFVAPMKFMGTQSYDKKELTFKVTGKVKPGKQDAAVSEFKLRLHDALHKAGIKVLGADVEQTKQDS